MPGQCYGCASTFGVFKKEHGCKNCGYSFCKDCLTKKAAIPKCNNEKHKVCSRCFDLLSGKKAADNSTHQAPPDVYLKRVSALDNRTPGTQKQTNVAMEQQGRSNVDRYRGMSKEDIAIAQRLDNLKESRRQEAKPVPSQREMEERLSRLKQDNAPPPPAEHEIADRLARLQGQDQARPNQPFVYQPDRRTQQEQIDNLLDEIGDEVEIDSRAAEGPVAAPPPEAQVQHVQGRLNSLREVEKKDHNIFKEDGLMINNLNTQNPSTKKLYNKNILGGESGAGAQRSFEKVTNIEQAQQAQSLSQQVAADMEADAHRAIEGLKKDKELWDTIQKLKKKADREKRINEGGSGEAAGGDESEEENEDIVAEQLIKQLLKESHLEDKDAAMGYNNLLDQAPVPPVGGASVSNLQMKKKQNQDVDLANQVQADPDELPWCCICHEDATVRCQGCDWDLYCRRCFREGHDRLDYQDHRTVPYKPPNK